MNLASVQVYPDGSSSMQNPGGGGVQTLFAYQLYNQQQQQVGLAAGVGPDLPPACTQWLTSCGVRLDGLLQHSHPTPRAWQVLEEDGRRAEVRVAPSAWWESSDGLCATTSTPLATVPSLG